MLLDFTKYLFQELGATVVISLSGVALGLPLMGLWLLSRAVIRRLKLQPEE